MQGQGDKLHALLEGIILCDQCHKEETLVRGVCLPKMVFLINKVGLNLVSPKPSVLYT